MHLTGSHEDQLHHLDPPYVFIPQMSPDPILQDLPLIVLLPSVPTSTAFKYNFFSLLQNSWSPHLPSCAATWFLTAGHDA